MSDLIDALAGVIGYAVPWWLWGLPGALGVLVLLRVCGPKAGAAATAALVLVLAHRRGAQAGHARALEQGDRDAAKSLSAAKAARDAAARRDGDARRLRDDDGYRRD